MHKIPAPGWHPGRATWAGIVATVVYSLAMKADKKVLNNQFDDVRFLEGMLGNKKNTRQGMIWAWLLHFGNGIGLANVYAAGGKSYMPGPNWLKGSLFGVIFIVAAWMLTPLADRYHPLIVSGEMPKLATPSAFFQNVLRHIVFGLTLGLVYKDKA